jgi:hypothetical protein
LTFKLSVHPALTKTFFKFLLYFVEINFYQNIKI